MQEAVAVTALEVIVAFIIAVPLGAAAGILIAENDYLGEIFKPMLFYVFSIPKSIFLPMFILVFGIGFQQKVAYAAFTTAFVVLMSATAAVESVRSDHIMVARSYGATRMQILLARLRAEHAADPARDAAHLHDLQLHRRDDRRDVCLAHRHRPPDRQLGRELPDAAAVRRRDRAVGGGHPVQRSRARPGGSMQHLANLSELRAQRRRGRHRGRRPEPRLRAARTAACRRWSTSPCRSAAGRFVVIVGPSGCGKTSLLMMMAGLRHAIEGTILCHGRPIPEPDPERVGVIFQEASLFPWLTTLDNIEFPLSLRGMPREERRRRSQAMLSLVGLEGFGERYPARAVRRHEAARVDRPRAGAGPAGAADGRAVRRARRADAHDHGPRAAAHLVDRPQRRWCSSPTA